MRPTLIFERPIFIKTKDQVNYKKRIFEIGNYGPSLDAFAEMVGESIVDFLKSKYCQDRIGHFYANPMWVLEGLINTPEENFKKAVQWAIIDWKKNLNQVLGAGPVRRMSSDMKSSQRTFSTFGYLEISGVTIHPKKFGQLIRNSA